MKIPGEKPSAPAGRDERLYDEKIRLIRPGKLIAGLVMIGVAVIWIVLENMLDPSAPRAIPNQPGVTASPMPSVHAVQSFAGGVADVAVQARLSRLNGRAVSAGSFFLVVAIQVGNRSANPLRVSATDFTLMSDAGTIDSGIVLAGHDAVFAPLGIPAKATEEGDLAFPVPNSASSLVLTYRPRLPGAVQLKWSVPVAAG